MTAPRTLATDFEAAQAGRAQALEVLARHPQKGSTDVIALARSTGAQMFTIDLAKEKGATALVFLTVLGTEISLAEDLSLERRRAEAACALGLAFYGRHHQTWADKWGFLLSPASFKYSAAMAYAHAFSLPLLEK